MDNYNYPAGADTFDAPWNQADVPEKELIVDAAELVPNDKIPFISVKGKKLFDVRNLDIVTYTRKKETIKARVVYLGKGKEDKDAVFTFVGQDGQEGQPSLYHIIITAHTRLDSMAL